MTVSLRSQLDAENTRHIHAEKINWHELRWVMWKGHLLLGSKFKFIISGMRQEFGCSYINTHILEGTLRPSSNNNGYLNGDMHTVDRAHSHPWKKMRLKPTDWEGTNLPKTVTHILKKIKFRVMTDILRGDQAVLLLCIVTHILKEV